MANELKITDVVDSNAIKQVQDLNMELIAMRLNYIEAAKKLAETIKMPVNNFTDIANKASIYQGILVKLGSTVKDINAIQQQQAKVLSDVSKGLKNISNTDVLNSQFEKLSKSIDRLNETLSNFVSHNKEVGQTIENIASTTQVHQQFAEVNVNYEQLSSTIADYSSEVTNLAKNLANNQSLLSTYRNEQKNLDKEYKDGVIPLSEYLSRSSELKQRIAEVSAEIQKEQNILRNHSQAVVAAEGSYNQMNAAMLELQKRYKELSEADRNSGIGEGIIKQASELNGKLKEIDAMFGNYQRNVGNYASAFNGLGYQVTQLVRELPALSSGFNTFMIAIGNNLPMLVGEIDRARKLNAQMAAGGNKTVPVWKQVTGAIFNWQTALVVGLTLITMYWKDIANFFQELFTGAKGYDAIAEAQKKYNEAMKEGAKNAAREVTEVEILYKASQDQNRSLEERRKAIDKLQKDYPKYFGNMSQEEILAGKAAGAYDRLKESIIKQAQARAIATKIEEASLAKVEAEIEAAKQEKIMQDNAIKSNYGKATVYLGTSTVGAGITQETKEARAYNNAEKALKKYNATITENQALIDELSKKIDVSAYIPDEEEINNKGNKAKEKERDILKELIQTRIDLIEENRARELAQNEKDFQEKMKGLEKESELYKNYEELRRRNEVKINDKYDKAIVKERITKEKENLQNRLSVMEEGNMEYVQTRMRLLKLEEEEERIAAEESGASVLDIEKKYEAEKLKVLQDYADKRADIVGNEYATRAVTSTQKLQSELEELSELYANGKIDAEEYEEKRTKLTNDYAIESAKLGIEMVKKQLETENLSAEKRMELNQALIDAEIALQDAVIASNEEQARAREEAFAKAREGFETLRDVADEAVEGMGSIFDGLYNLFETLGKKSKLSAKEMTEAILGASMQIVEGVKEIGSQMYESEIEELEKEEEANEEAHEKEMERIEQLANHGAISEEEAEARKRAAEDKTAAKNAEVQKKKAELQTKQAKFEKAMNIGLTIMATSRAVVNALPNLVLAALVGAMGAVQLAAIIAQPIPKYANGTKDHKGGLAIVGDGGKHEGVITEKGMWITPDKPTLVDLPVHAMVIPDITKYTSPKGLRSDLLNKPRGGNDPVIVNVNNDYKRLEQEMMGNRGELKKLTKVVKKMSRTSELRGIYGRL